MSEIYTASRLRVIRSCLRQHHYRYVRGLQTPQNDQMRFGTVGHSALEAWYRAWMADPADEDIENADEEDGEMMYEDRREALSSRLPSAYAAITSELSPVDAAKLRVLTLAYHNRWGAEDWEVLAVEVEFAYMLGEHEIRGKIDAIIRDRKDGRIYVVEHKTTGADASLGSPYWERLTIDQQVSIYIDGAAMLGYDVSGCIYDVLKRPAHELKLATPLDKREYTKGKGCKACGGSAGGKAGIFQGRGAYSVAFASEVKVVTCNECHGTGWKLDDEGKPQAPRLHKDQRDSDETIDEFEARIIEAIAENPDAFLLRGVVVRLDDELPAMRQDVLDAIAIAETGITARNPDACARGKEMCGYFDLCAGRAREDDFTSGRAHPELAA